MHICPDHQLCSDSALRQAEELCSKRNIKLTSLRKSILRVIWQSHVPIKAYEIIEKLGCNSKPITVYRILDFFLANRIIHKLESQNAFLGCAHPDNSHNCCFIICKHCNVAQEYCENDFINNITTRLTADEFKIEHVILEIHGVCKDCANLR
jgi:Fur family zinc uptake transcriptional regulator